MTDTASCAPAPTRILRIVTRLNIGGPAIHVSLLSTRLDPQRFDTCLVVGQPDATEGDLSSTIPAAVRMIRLRTLQRSLRPLNDLRTLWRLLRITWQQRPHLIHTHMAKAGTLGRLAGLLYNRIGPGRRERAVLLHTFHGHVLDGYFSGPSERLFTAIERALARHTDHLIAVSDTVKQDLLALGIGRPEQWHVIPVGLNVASLGQLPMPNGAPTVRFGLIGRLVPIKNPSLFLDGLRRTTQAGSPPVQGIVVGDGPLRATLERETAALGLDSLVRFTGWQRDLSQVYANLEVACLTSWNEGTPIAMIEAMAAGRAVVATNAGGVRDLLLDPGQTADPAPGTFQQTERGLLVRPGDAEGLASAMTALATDVGLRRRLGQAAREHVLQRFTEERLLRDITALYERLRTTERLACTH